MKDNVTDRIQSLRLMKQIIHAFILRNKCNGYFFQCLFIKIANKNNLTHKHHKGPVRKSSLGANTDHGVVAPRVQV